MLLLCVNAYAAATKFICLNCEKSEPAKPAPVLSGARTLIMIAHHGMSYNWSPAEDSPERPWAR